MRSEWYWLVYQKVESGDSVSVKYAYHDRPPTKVSFCCCGAGACGSSDKSETYTGKRKATIVQSRLKATLGPGCEQVSTEQGLIVTVG